MAKIYLPCDHPVKSMAAEALDSPYVSWHGLAGDRRWAFIPRWHDAHRLSVADHPAAADDVAVRAPIHRARPAGRVAGAGAHPSGAGLETADPALAAERSTSVPVL